MTTAEADTVLPIPKLLQLRLVCPKASSETEMNASTAVQKLSWLAGKWSDRRYWAQKGDGVK